MAQIVRFWPEIRRPGPSDFQIEKWHRLKIQDVIRDSVAAERSMSWIATQLDTDVASHLTHSRRAARLSVARLVGCRAWV